MPSLHYEIVDVFTEQPFAGNALAVVLDADGLPTEALQRLAREFNLSETAFPLAPRPGRSDYRLRIFTPYTELPFAGHPSIGAAWVLHRLGRLRPGSVVQECGVGLVTLHIGNRRAEDPDPGELSHARAHAPPEGLPDSDEVTLGGGAPTQSPPLDPDRVAELVGLGGTVDGVDRSAPVRRAGCGLAFTFLRVTVDGLARSRPLTGPVPDDLDIGAGVAVVVWDPDRRQARVRVFAGAVGIAEDPATGSAALGLGVWLVAAGLLPGSGMSCYRIDQGVEMGRPSVLHGRVRAEEARATAAWVSGNVVSVASGEVRRP